MGEFARTNGVLHQPRFDQFSFESPLIADLECRKLFLRQQAVNGKSVHIKVFSDFFEG